METYQFNYTLKYVVKKFYSFCFSIHMFVPLFDHLVKLDPSGGLAKMLFYLCAYNLYGSVTLR